MRRTIGHLQTDRDARRVQLPPSRGSADVPAVRASVALRWRAAVEAVSGWIGRPWRQRATQTYALLVTASLLWLHEANDRVAHAALRTASTNLTQLRHDPISALLTSAVWVDFTSWGAIVRLAVVFVVVFAPLEARIGTARWVAGFAAGHVGATLIVATGLAIGVRTGLADPAVAHTIDVGWSYGGMCLIAMLAYLVPRRWRVPFVLLLVVTVLVPLREATFTDWGHVAAVGIGLVLGRWLVPARARDAASGAPVSSSPAPAALRAVGTGPRAPCAAPRPSPRR